MDSIEQKARELADKFLDCMPTFMYKGDNLSLPVAKRCAVICVDEFIEYLKPIDDFTKPYRKELPPEENISLCDYWQQVKEKIQSL